MPENVPTAALLSIGDEVLRGDTVDTNKAFLGAELTVRGVEVRLAVTIPDDFDSIVSWVRRLTAGHDWVFSFGGIGSTPDDLTRPAVAAAFDRKLVLFEAEMLRCQAARGRELNASQREMWRIPAGAELLWGENVTVPGFRVENLHVFPGVPRIMQLMWADIAGRFSCGQVYCRRFRSRVAESRYSELMQEFMQRYPQVHFGSYPKLGDDNRWSVELALHGRDEAELERVCAEFRAAIEGLGPNPW